MRGRAPVYLVASLLACLAAAAAASAQAGLLSGVVRDARGAPVAGAAVTVTAGGEVATTTTDREGRFAVSVDPAARATVAVRAPGFAAAEVSLDGGAAGRGATAVEVVLEPSPFAEEVTVTASRVEARTADTAASVVVLSERDIEATAAVTLDAALRQVPGFSLFRRADSRVANPTTQGASLRGVAPSGASRVAVLVDGVPVNDPFGGWVYWGRAPREAVRRVEVVRGGASSLYGSDALGGVVNVITDPAGAAPRLSLEASGGTQGTGLMSAAGGAGAGPWRAWGAAELFRTGGYRVVAEDERGPVDVEAGGEHASLEARVERDLWGAGRLFARAAYFAEERENGTPLQTNQTRIREASAGLDLSSERLGTLALRLYGGTQGYDQSFTAVAEDRASEALTRLQYVPAQQAGLSAQWARGLGARLAVVAGVDAREVRGRSMETGFFEGRATSASEAGGRQRSVGLFGEAALSARDDLLVTAGARYDRWRNFAASASARPLGPFGSPSLAEFEDREESAFSPRLAVVYRATPAVSLRAAAYRAFRAPTLNELYRGFRVGDVVTLANERLRAERLTGAEAGATLVALDGRLSARGTFYWSEVTRPVANVTLSAAPDLITRRRENLGRVRARGLEIDVDARPAAWLSLTGGYVFSDSTVVRFEASPALEGLRVPQVPRHQVALQALVLAPWRVTAGAQARFVGEQFDDDRNQLALASFATVDLLVSRPIAGGLELFGAVENLFGTRYEVGRTPVTTVGPPFSLRAGVRVRLPGR